MCGIVGYAGSRPMKGLLLSGLRRLEYRGYDSAGIAIERDGELILVKATGKIQELENRTAGMELDGSVGIAHTRWATHGEPNDLNAHPHTGCSNRLAVVHNGIIENYQALRKLLLDRDHLFSTETDTEVLAHLIEEHLQDGMNRSLDDAVRLALQKVEGTFGLVIIDQHHPGKMVVARRGSPIVIGVGENENFVGSDASAFAEYTRDIIYLQDDEIATITSGDYSVRTLQDEARDPIVEEITWELDQIEKGGFDHFMLKEIHEQPQTVEDSMRGRVHPDTCEVKLGGLETMHDVLASAERIILTACGTSWHACLVARRLFEDFVRIPVEVEYASEFRYSRPVFTPGTILFAVSQSGETADTLAALRLAKDEGIPVLGIVNVVGSTIARETDAGVYLHAGPEIGVASTKAFTSQVTVLSQVALLMARLKGTLSKKRCEGILYEIVRLPGKIQSILDHAELIREMAPIFSQVHNALYLGRGYNFPVALEGALKLKEISYIHAEGYPAAEMKHGPIALIDDDMPVVVLAPGDQVYQKVISNIEEIRARKGRILVIASEGNENIRDLATWVVHIPRTLDCFYPLLTVIPLQLLSYYVAVARGCDVDQPRNLAKSVTVE
ncbi:glutamine--fructose-6-phosphate transaminase (isomerizing) [Gemmatimonadota bacterium]